MLQQNEATWLNLMRLVMISGAENRKPNLNQWHPYRWEVVDLSRWHISQLIVCVFSSHTILPRTAKAISTPRASHIVCKIDRVIRVAARGHQCPCVVSISTRIPPRCPDSFVATLPRSWIAARLWSALSKDWLKAFPGIILSLDRKPDRGAGPDRGSVPIGQLQCVFTLSPAFFWFWVPRDDTRMMRPSDWKSRMIRVISTSFALTGFSHGAAHFSHAFSAGPFPLNPLFHLTVGELGMKGWRDERAGYKSPPSMLHGKGVYNGRQSSRRLLNARTERSSPKSPL